MDIEIWFALAMKRGLLPPIETGHMLSLDLGAGNTPVPGAEVLDYPEWKAPEPIPYGDASVGTVWAHHFFEHLSGHDAILTLREVQRVLRPRGLANIVVPYYSSQMQAQDLDHKSVWCEETWRNLFKNPYYTKEREEPWELSVYTCFILGLNERNLALFTQLRKE